MSASTRTLASSLACRANGSSCCKTLVSPSRTKRRILKRSWTSSPSTKTRRSTSATKMQSGRSLAMQSRQRSTLPMLRVLLAWPAHCLLEASTRSPGQRRHHLVAAARDGRPREWLQQAPRVRLLRRLPRDPRPPRSWCEDCHSRSRHRRSPHRLHRPPRAALLRRRVKLQRRPQLRPPPRSSPAHRRRSRRAAALAAARAGPAPRRGEERRRRVR